MARRGGHVPLSVHPGRFSLALTAALSFTLAPGAANAQPQPAAEQPSVTETMPPARVQPPLPPAYTRPRIQFQLRGFGGAAFINGHTAATAGLDGAVLFPLGNRLLVGPTAGFQWVDSSIVKTVGTRQPGSTFIDTSAWFNQVNLGARAEYRFHYGVNGSGYGNPIDKYYRDVWDVGVEAGVTVANSKITQQLGFCGQGNATSPAGCNVFSTVKTHDTVTSPYVGGYIGHSIFPHVGIFVGYDYHFGLKDTKANPTNPSGPRVNVFDLHYSTVKAGVLFNIGAPRAIPSIPNNIFK